MNIPDPQSEIDFEHLKQYVGEDDALTKEVFGLFKHQVEMWSRGMVFDAEDESWATIMHSLKGTARAIGALNLATLCSKGEGLVGPENKPEIRKRLVQDVQFCIDRVLIEIQRWEYRQTLASLRS